MATPADARTVAQTGSGDTEVLPNTSPPATAPAGPPPARRDGRRLRLPRVLAAVGWYVASLALFASLWELAWAVGWADPMLIPPPHVFLQDLGGQAANFGSQGIGEEDPSPLLAVLTTVASTMLRVLAGLALGFIASLAVGLAVTYFRTAGKLVVPTITMLAPISPIAWLPVAIFLFGIGNAPAVFLVFIGVFFLMTLATISEIQALSPMWRDVARTMGATRPQMVRHVVLPAILPGLFVLLRLNLFAAWMVVLIAEAVGVGSGLGMVVLLARNTFNAPLVFFTMTVIGVAGFCMDIALRAVQRKVLWWDAGVQAVAR